MKTKNGVVPNVEDAEFTPDSGVKVEDTKMLSGLGDLPSGYNISNPQKPYETGPQPRGPSSAKPL